MACLILITGTLSYTSAHAESTLPLYQKSTSISLLSHTLANYYELSVSIQFLNSLINDSKPRPICLPTRARTLSFVGLYTGRHIRIFKSSTNIVARGEAVSAVLDIFCYSTPMSLLPCRGTLLASTSTYTHDIFSTTFFSIYLGSSIVDICWKEDHRPWTDLHVCLHVKSVSASNYIRSHY